MVRPRVLVTPRSLSSAPAKARALLAVNGLEPVFPPPGDQPSLQTLIDLLPGCVGWIAGVEPIGDAVLQHAGDLRVISRYGSGTDKVDMTAAEAHDITVLSAPGANAQGVAELAVAFTLDCLRSVSASSQALREGRWERHQGREIRGLFVVTVGLGAIGQRYSDAMTALGATVCAVDPVVTPRAGIRLVGSLDEVVHEVDVISLHCPVRRGEGPLIGADLLSRARTGVVLVNTARAELVDEEALLAALDDGRVGWYAVDAFHTEPPPPSKLLRHPHVLPTPHIGAYTTQAAERTLQAAVDNLVEGLRQ
jgi:D-3-phosphoglycerate dehydrogenase